MGLGFSGDVCDITFFATVEDGFVTNPRLLARFEVHVYVWYRDDILVIASGTALTRLRFVEALRLRSRVRKLEVAEISKNECHYLDLHLAKICGWHSTGILDISIYHKPTSLHRY